MKSFKSVSTGVLLLLFIGWPAFMSGTRQQVREIVEAAPVTTPTASPGSIPVTPEMLLEQEANSLYDSMHLKRAGLAKKAFLFAYKGYKNLLQDRKVYNDDVLSICDFSQSSRRKRMYIVDVQKKKLLLNTYVAHGRNSGAEYARSFSNKPESHKSSLGFYVTRNTYYGEHGLALKIDGLENGINDKAGARNIVIHGSDYVGAGYLRGKRFNGRSFGCPAVPKKDTQKLIHTIKGGSCLFIYHPTTHYLSKSTILNG
jgi:hypothetical protein